MKKITSRGWFAIVIWLVFACNLLSLMKCMPEDARAELYKTKHLWASRIACTVTETDSAFTHVWLQTSVWFDGCDGYIKIGSPDTVQWASRNYLYVFEGQVIEFGPSTKLTRLEFKAVSGSGHFNMAGYKDENQFGE